MHRAMAPPNRNQLVHFDVDNIDPRILEANPVERSTPPWPKKQKIHIQEQLLDEGMDIDFFDPVAEGQIRFSQRLTISGMEHSENEQPISSIEGEDVEMSDGDSSEWAGIVVSKDSRKRRSESLDDYDSATMSDFTMSEYEYSSDYTSESNDTLHPGTPIVPQILLEFDREHKLMAGVVYVERMIAKTRPHEVIYDRANECYIASGKLRPRCDNTSWMRVSHTMRRREDFAMEVRDELSKNNFTKSGSFAGGN